MTEFSALFVAQFIAIFFKAFQQRNVAFMHYGWVMPTSYALATAEVVMISYVAARTIATGDVPWVYALVLGTAGGSGALAAMYLHKRWLK